MPIDLIQFTVKKPKQYIQDVQRKLIHSAPVANWFTLGYIHQAEDLTIDKGEII